MDDDRENRTAEQPVRRNKRLYQILRPSNPLIVNASSNCAADRSKSTSFRRPRLHLSLNFLNQHHQALLHWLDASFHSIHSFPSHRSSWPQVFLTYLLEDPSIKLDFRPCYDCSKGPTHVCVSEEEAHQLQSIFRKRKRLSFNALLIEHLRQIILLRHTENETEQRERLAEELRQVHQTLIDLHPTWPHSRIRSMHSKLLLFLSSLYSMKMETIRMFFIQHPSSFSSLSR